jgi:endonuclease G, mitochondrial
MMIDRAVRGFGLASLALLLSICSAVAAPFDDCKDHLPFGVPSLARAAPTTPVCHVGYAVLHDDKLMVPRWVAYRLTGPHTLGCVKRTDNFHAEENLPDGKRATPADYKGSKLDQGHQAPAQDFAWNLDRMKDSFSMANMAPQVPGLNRAQWLRVEESVRAWATDRGELIVYVGPMLANTSHTIGKNKVVVPTAFWKVVVDPDKKEALAFVLPNRSIAKGKLEPWQSDIADVEQAAGVKLPLPSGIDRETKPTIWPANLSGWAKKHKEACPPAKKGKKAVAKKKKKKKKA